MLDDWRSKLGTDFLREMEIRCALCLVRHVGTCRKCHIGRCTQYQQAEEQCEVCDVSTKSTPDLGGRYEEHSPPALDGKRRKGVEAIRSVNMHQLGVNFVERVLDVRKPHKDDGKELQAAALKRREAKARSSARASMPGTKDTHSNAHGRQNGFAKAKAMHRPPATAGSAVTCDRAHIAAAEKASRANNAAIKEWQAKSMLEVDNAK